MKNRLCIVWFVFAPKENVLPHAGNIHRWTQIYCNQNTAAGSFRAQYREAGMAWFFPNVLHDLRALSGVGLRSTSKTFGCWKTFWQHSHSKVVVLLKIIPAAWPGLPNCFTYFMKGGRFINFNVWNRWKILCCNQPSAWGTVSVQSDIRVQLGGVKTCEIGHRQ